ncbi:MAG TPA: hypothetical protein VGS13_04575 [Stellaceae bacterium]|nr:hypothetical protein [Stellaceae bacterium]
MPLYRVFAAATLALVVLVPVATTAQELPQPQITLQYHEMVPADADTAPIFTRIFERFQKDCEAIGKAFNKKCVISQANVNLNTNYGGDMTGPRNLNANATITLLPGPAGGAPTR